MSSERLDEFDDYDDHMSGPQGHEASPPPPLDDERERLRRKYQKPGFGFWMAVVWCLLFTVVMQILAALFCGIPVILIAMAIDAGEGQPLNDPQGWMKSDTGTLAMIIVLILSHIVGLLFGWLILRWQAGKNWKRKVALTRLPSPTHLVLVLIGMCGMMALSASIEVPIMKYIPSIQDLLDRAGIQFEWPGVEAVEPILKKTPFTLAIFAIAVLPGINEELWCRGFLGQGLNARYKTWIAVLMTSFLFGCIHLEPRQGVNAMLLGAVIHSAYLATRTLLIPMLIHFLHNGLAVVHINENIPVAILKPIEDLLQRSPVSAALLVAGALALCGAVAYALYQTRCKLTAVEPGMPVWEPEGKGGVGLPPPGCGTVVTHEPIKPLSVSLVLIGAVIFGSVLAFA